MNDETRLAAIDAGPTAIFAAIAQSLHDRPGYDLFTILAPNPSGDRLDRLFSTNEDQYPLGPADQVNDDLWFRRLFQIRLPIVANTMDEIGNWLPDYAIFIEQNYFSLLNLPVVFAGQTIGLINMMAGPHHFDAAALSEIDAAIPLAALAILGATCRLPSINLQALTDPIG
jgi:hypothetical protein